MANWPEELPQEWYGDDGPGYAADDNTIRTSVTAGPAKMRRRFTAQTEQVTLAHELTDDEIAVLKDFVKKTLGEVKTFTWIDFSTDNPATYRFPQGWKSVGRKFLAGDLWIVTLTLELMP